MYKKIVVMLGMLSVALMGCSAMVNQNQASPSAAPILQFNDQTACPNPFILKIGQQFSFTVDENVTTGYSWNFTGDELFDKQLKRASEGKPTPKVIVVGAGDTNSYIFTAQKVGKTNLTATYQRGWEPRHQPNWQCNIEVVAN